MKQQQTSVSNESLEQQVAELTKENSALQDKVSKTQAVSRAKSEFLANMSREIRTPLTVILGFGENMESPDQSEPDRADAVKTIRHHAERLRGIVDDVLDLSKLEAGKMVIEPNVCDPVEIVAQALCHARVQADRKGLPIEVEFDGAMPLTIRTDPSRLRQMLVALFDNAVKFTSAGKVSIMVTAVDQDTDRPLLQIDVADTGEGMTQEHVDRLFKPFARAYSSTSRRHGGSGMGLAIGKRLARMLGGDLCLLETQPGAGSRFRATVATSSLADVPMRDDPQASLDAVPAPQSSVKNTTQHLSGCRVLLVEDGPDNQRLLEHILVKSGAQVTVASNGRTAVEQVLGHEGTDASENSSSAFHVILMDMQMPVMDGYEATRQLREKGCEVAIIAQTAYATTNDRDKCLDAGCDDYLTKPIERQRLIDAVATRFEDQAEWVMPEPDDEPLVSDMADDADMLRLIEMFILDLSLHVTGVDQAMRSDDLAALTKLAQQIKSSAGSHGFAPIAEAADELALRAPTARSTTSLIPLAESLVVLCRSAVADRKSQGVPG